MGAVRHHVEPERGGAYIIALCRSHPCPSGNELLTPFNPHELTSFETRRAKEDGPLNETVSETDSTSRQRIRVLWIALVYALVAILTQAIFETVAVWPAAGVAIAMALRWGRRAWIGVFMGSIVSDVSWGLLTGKDLLTGPATLAMFGIAAGSGLAVVATASALRATLAARDPFGTPSDTLRLCLWGFVTYAVVSAASAMLVFRAWAQPWAFPITATDWMVSNLVGGVVVAPPVLLWYRGWPHLEPRERFEVASLFLAAIGLSLCLFGPFFGFAPAAVQFESLLLLPLFWAAIRLDPRLSVTLTAVCFVLVWWGTNAGYGLYRGDPYAVVRMQALMASICAILLFVLAEHSQRRRAVTDLQHHQARLEEAVRQRTLTLQERNHQLMVEAAKQRQASEALRESEERNRSLIEHAPTGIYKIDFATGRFTEVNDVMCRILGYTHEQLLSMSAFEVLDDEGRVRFAERTRLARSGGRPSDAAEYRVRTREGRMIWALVNTSFKSEGDRIVSATVVAHDITELKMAREAARQSEERLLQASQAAGLGMYATEFETGARYWSPELKALWGLGPDAPVVLEDDSLPSFVHPQDRSRLLEALSLANDPKGDGRVDMEYRVVWPDGSIRWLRAHGRTEFAGVGDQRRPWRTGGATMDITERRQTEDALSFLARYDMKPTEDFFHSLARYLGESLGMDFVCIDRLTSDLLTARTEAMFVNGSFEDNVSYTLKDTPCGDVVGKTVCCFPSEVRHLFPNDDVLQKLEAESYTGVTLWGHTGEPIGLIAVIGKRPLTNPQMVESILKLVAVRAGGELERKEAEEELRVANESLELKVRQRTSDLADTIDALEAEARQRQAIEQALRQANEQTAARAAQLRALAGELTLVEQRERRRMARVLHDHLQQLLVGAKFRAAILGRTGDDVIRNGAAEIEGLLDESIKASRSLTAELSPPILHEGGLGPGLQWLARWMNEHHDLIVDLHMEEDILPLVEDVKVLLFESVRELLFNAVKHARVHTASVHVRMIEGRRLHVTVSDDGCGFDPAGLKPAGTAGGGFGLFSIRERLDLFGGRLDIDSAPGAGSRFLLVVPIVAVVEARPEPSKAALSSSPDGAPLYVVPPASGSRIRVLLADDHAIMRQGLASLLCAEPDIDVVGQASDGQEAVLLASQLLPDVILMDMSMPRLNGVEATRAIHENHPDIRIIALSMFDESEHAAAMRDAGATSYLTKSGPAAELIAGIRTCVVGDVAQS
jgi:PAS domain S-box-containing protein